MAYNTIEIVNWPTLLYHITTTDVSTVLHHSSSAIRLHLLLLLYRYFIPKQMIKLTYPSVPYHCNICLSYFTLLVHLHWFTTVHILLLLCRYFIPYQMIKLTHPTVPQHNNRCPLLLHLSGTTALVHLLILLSRYCTPTNAKIDPPYRTTALQQMFSVTPHLCNDIPNFDQTC